MLLHNKEITAETILERGIIPVMYMGDEINQLPEGSKTVTVNGEKLYVTPDETYLKEVSEENIIKYKVVGK